MLFYEDYEMCNHFVRFGTNGHNVHGFCENAKVAVLKPGFFDSGLR